MSREHRFTMQRQDGWDELEILLVKAKRRGLHRLEPQNLERFALLYRATTADLATAQTRGYDDKLLAYLNRLIARSHAYVYASTTRDSHRYIARFFAETFPREVRASSAPIFAATALFLITSIIAYGLVTLRTQNIYALLPASAIPLVSKGLHDSNFAFDRDFAPTVSAAIITNNIQVAALAFAGGMTLGIYTVWEIINNGLMLGGLGALFNAKGFGLDFLATIAPHGIIELSAIQISAGAGFLLASAITVPGRLRRIDALKIRARRAGILILGVIAMLIVAGIIEGFVSPQRTSVGFRLSIGAATALLLTAYFSLAGQPKNENGFPRIMSVQEPK